MKAIAAISCVNQLSLVLITLALFSCTTPEERALPPVENIEHEPVVTETRTDTVKIIGMKFVPDVITVTPGTTIVFINNDIVSHDITEETTKAWSSKLLAPSKSWKMVAHSSANYFCSIHIIMKGKIMITQ